MLACALALAWTTIVALILARAHTHRLPVLSPLPSSENIIVLRPITSADRNNLVDFAAAPPQSLVQAAFVYLVDAQDPIAPELDAIAARLRAQGRNIEVERTHAQGRNRKVGQLAHATRRTQDTRFVITIDADVTLATVPVDALLAPFAQESVGAVWAPFVLAGKPSTPADRIARAVLHGSLHAVPLLARLDTAGMVSKILAYRPKALAQVGGWASVENCIGDDMALSKRLRRAGFGVVCAGVNAETQRSHKNVVEVAQRFGRWCAIMADQRPGYFLTYPGLIAFTPWLLMLWAFAANASGRSTLCACGALVTIAVRLLLARSARLACNEPTTLGQAFIDSAIADVFMNVVALHALLKRDVVWAGRRLSRHAAGATDRETGHRAKHPGGDARDAPQPRGADSASDPTT